MKDADAGQRSRYSAGPDLNDAFRAPCLDRLDDG
jgi:hypothetical protein